jgi:hypothetical protein
LIKITAAAPWQSKYNMLVIIIRPSINSCRSFYQIPCQCWAYIYFQKEMCILPSSVFSRKDKTEAARYKTTNNVPYFTYLEIPLLGDCRRWQRRKASTLKELIDAAQYCISRYANSVHGHMMLICKLYQPHRKPRSDEMDNT